LKFANTVSPPPPLPQFHILEGTAKKIFRANAPTLTPPNLGPSLRQWVLGWISYLSTTKACKNCDRWYRLRL